MASTQNSITVFIRRLGFAWLITVLVIGILAITSEFLVERVLRQHENDTQQINAYGFQRTLSQEIALLSLRLLTEDVHSQLSAKIAAFQSQQDIQAQNPNILYTRSDTPLAESVQAYLEAAQRLVNLSEMPANHPDLRYIQTEADNLLLDLDLAVDFYQAQSVRNLASLRQVNRLRIALVVLMLVLQMAFVVRPLLADLSTKARALISEIAERQRAQTALQEQKYFIEKVTQTMPDLLYVYNRQKHNMVYSNQTVYQGHALQQGLEAFMIHPDDKLIQQTMLELWAILPDNEVLEVEYRVQHQNGSYHTLLVRSSVFSRDSAGKVQELLAICQDITERKLAQQRSQELEREQERSKILEEFVSVTSHDLKTPLAAIGTGVYLLSKSSEESQKQERLTTIKAHIQQLTHRIGQLQELVSFNRLKNNPFQMIPVQDLFRQVQMLYYNSNRIHLDIANADLQIQGVASYLQKALSYLLDNALRYSPDESEIHVRASLREGTVQIEVQDFGIGIPSEDVPLIFDTFYKANKARTSDGSGAGLGLSIAKRIIDLHGGTIGVESVEGQGSTFRIVLPQA